MKKRSLFFTVIAMAAGLTSAVPTAAGAQGQYQPAPWTAYSTSLYATGPDVWVRFFGSSAGFHNSLFYTCDLAATPSCQQFLFDNHNAAFQGGEEARILHTFTVGEEVIFRMTNGSDNWFTGPAGRNVDNALHFATQAYSDVTVNANYSVLGGFEDLNGGGDQDFNDIMFEFGNVSTTATTTPEPASLALVATGLVGVAGIARRRRKSDVQA